MKPLSKEDGRIEDSKGIRILHTYCLYTEGITRTKSRNCILCLQHFGHAWTNIYYMNNAIQLNPQKTIKDGIFFKGEIGLFLAKNVLHNYKAHRRSTVNSYSGKAFKLRHPQQGFGSEDSMENMTDVGQPTLNRNQQTRVRGTDGCSRAESQEQRVGWWAAGKAATET